MTRASLTRKAIILLSALLGFGAGLPVAAAPVWFDGTDGTRSHAGFDEPVVALGAFPGRGPLGNVHNLSVGAWDADDPLASGRMLDSWLWEVGNNRQGYGSLLGLYTGVPALGPAEFHGHPGRGFGNGLLIDDVGLDRQSIPEPSTHVFLGFSVGLLLLHWPGRRARTHA